MFNVGKPSPAPCQARSIDRSGRVGRSGVEWPVQRRPPNSQSGESDSITGHMHMQPAAAAQATLYHPCRRVLANVVWVASVGLSLSQVADIDSSSSIMFRPGFQDASRLTASPLAYSEPQSGTGGDSPAFGFHATPAWINETQEWPSFFSVFSPLFLIRDGLGKEGRGGHLGCCLAAVTSGNVQKSTLHGPSHVSLDVLGSAC